MNKGQKGWIAVYISITLGIILMEPRHWRFAVGTGIILIVTEATRHLRWSEMKEQDKEDDN